MAGSYRKFIPNYANLIRSPTPLTCENTNFSRLWTDKKQHEFQTVKEKLCKQPVLARLDFAKLILVECGACGYGIGAILSQEGHIVSWLVGLQAQQKETIRQLR